MVNQNLFHHTLRIASALALVVAMVTSPIQSSWSSGGSSPAPVHLQRNAHLPPTHSTLPSSKSLAERQVRVKALPSETEEDLIRVARTASWHLDLPLISAPTHEWDLASSGPHGAIHPLRC